MCHKALTISIADALHEAWVGHDYHVYYRNTFPSCPKSKPQSNGMPVSHLNMSITSRITDHHHRRRRRAQIASNMHILAIKRNLNNGSQLQAAAFPLSGQFTYIHTIYTFIILCVLSGSFSSRLRLPFCTLHLRAMSPNARNPDMQICQYCLIFPYFRSQVA